MELITKFMARIFLPFVWLLCTPTTAQVLSERLATQVLNISWEIEPHSSSAASSSPVAE